jgi:hypothetical protein
MEVWSQWRKNAPFFLPLYYLHIKFAVNIFAINQYISLYMHLLNINIPFSICFNAHLLQGGTHRAEVEPSLTWHRGGNVGQEA